MNPKVLSAIRISWNHDLTLTCHSFYLQISCVNDSLRQGHCVNNFIYTSSNPNVFSCPVHAVGDKNSPVGPHVFWCLILITSHHFLTIYKALFPQHPLKSKGQNWLSLMTFQLAIILAKRTDSSIHWFLVLIGRICNCVARCLHSQNQWLQWNIIETWILCTECGIFIRTLLNNYMR